MMCSENEKSLDFLYSCSLEEQKDVLSYVHTQLPHPQSYVFPDIQIEFITPISKIMKETNYVEHLNDNSGSDVFCSDVYKLIFTKHRDKYFNLRWVLK